MPAQKADTMTVHSVPVRKSKRRSCLAFFIVAAIILLMVSSLLFGGMLLVLPGRAEQVFGPASPRLNSLQRVGYSIMLLVQEKDLTQPVNSFGTDKRFTIEVGETTPSVIGRLWESGLISNPAAFRTYLRYSGLDTTLQAGTYTLNPRMAPIELAQALQDATPKQVTFPILPGWRIEEIAAALPTSGLSIIPEAFIQAAQSAPAGYSFSDQIFSQNSLEGFLFPDNYVYDREITVEEMLKAMLDNFEEQVTPRLRERYQQQNLSLLEAVTLASIVQREAVAEDEMPLIASVFFNRLSIGMKLDTDPTVQYAIGYNERQNTWWTNPLSLADLQFDSPYNTYLYPGLPPGPIANPSLAALRAVAFPAQTPYYYFRAGCDETGRHLFSATFEEHLQNACP
jgi:UPF0755 protein